MEKLKTIRSIVWVAGVFFFIQLAMFAFSIRPLTTYMWISLAVLALLAVYLVRVSLSLIRELKARNEGRTDWDD